MNRYAILFLSLFTLAGHSGPGSAHSANTSQLASARQPAEPDRDDATAATVPAEQWPVIRYSQLEAAVQLEHDYDGRMQPDVTETLTLRFRHGYTSGWMQVEFYAHDGLELYALSGILRALVAESGEPGLGSFHGDFLDAATARSMTGWLAPRRRARLYPVGEYRLAGVPPVMCGSVTMLRFLSRRPRCRGRVGRWR